MKLGESAAAQTQQYHLRTKPHDAIKLTTWACNISQMTYHWACVDRTWHWARSDSWQGYMLMGTKYCRYVTAYL